MYKNMSGMQKDEADDRMAGWCWREMNRSVYRVLFRRMRLKTGIHLNVINNPPTS